MTLGLMELERQLHQLADPEKAKSSARFFKTGLGAYGAGDFFLGIRVPELRTLSKQYQHLALSCVASLLSSPWHEKRLLAVYILVLQFKKADAVQKKDIFEFYLAHRSFINNWDIVDSSAHYIVGPYLDDKSKDVLYELAKDGNLWERRIAVLSTFHYIRNHNFEDALALAELLLHDSEDLIHKAVGWMLREIGNRDLATEEAFLNRFYHSMPRTMLRYAIEKMSDEKRQGYLKILR